MRIRTAHTAAALVALTLLCAACGTDANPSPPLPTLPADYHGVPVTGDPDTDTLPPAPSPQFGVQIIPSAAIYVPQEMADDLEWQIGKRVTVTTDCAAQLANTGQSRTFDCDAHWPGGPLGVPFAVTISADSELSYSVNVVQLKGLMLADQVRAAWLRSYTDVSYYGTDYAKTVSCDRSIPAATLVTLDKPTPYRCAVAGEIYYAQVSSASTGPGPGAEITFTSSETPSPSADSPS